MRHVLGILIVIKYYYAINQVENKFPLTGGPLGQANLPRENQKLYDKINQIGKEKVPKYMTKAFKYKRGNN